MTTEKTAIFVLEDDARIRSRFCRLIEDSGAFEVLGQAGSLSDAQQLRGVAQGCQLLLVDLQLPDGSGANFISEAASWQPRPRIIVISALGDERNVLSAIEAGADGYLLKDVDAQQIVPMLSALMQGEAPISPAIARHLLKRFRREPSAEASAPVLSGREKEVLELVARGLSFAEVAQQLSVAVSTVNTHVKHIYNKLDVNSRSEAVFEAAQLGIIRLNSP